MKTSEVQYRKICVADRIILSHKMCSFWCYHNVFHLNNAKLTNYKHNVEKYARQTTYIYCTKCTPVVVIVMCFAYFSKNKDIWSAISKNMRGKLHILSHKIRSICCYINIFRLNNANLTNCKCNIEKYAWQTTYVYHTKCAPVVAIVMCFACLSKNEDIWSAISKNMRGGPHIFIAQNVR